jgi:hypothetical protein
MGKNTAHSKGLLCFVKKNKQKTSVCHNIKITNVKKINPILDYSEPWLALPL